MRKIYVVIGIHTNKVDYYEWISGVYASRKKALENCIFLRKARPENEYRIQTEVLI